MGGFRISRVAELASHGYANSWLSCMQPLMQDVRQGGRSVFHRELFLESNPIPRIGQATGCHGLTPRRCGNPPANPHVSNGGTTHEHVHPRRKLPRTPPTNRVQAPFCGRLTSFQGKHTGAWAYALPITEYLTMSAEEWRSRVHLRIGVMIPHLVIAHNCQIAGNISPTSLVLRLFATLSGALTTEA